MNVSTLMPDEQKAALIKGRLSESARWEVLMCTRPTDVLTLDAFAQGYEYSAARRNLLDIVDVWRANWTQNPADGNEDEQFISARLREAYEDGLLSDGAYVTLLDGRIPAIRGSLLAWVAATTDSDLLGEIIADPATHGVAFSQVLMNPDVPTRQVDEIVTRLLDDSLAEYRATEPEYGYRKRPVIIETVRSCAAAVSLPPSTVQRLVDVYKELYPGYSNSDGRQDEPAYIGRLPGIDIQPYPVDVQRLLVGDTTLWFRKSMMVRNPHVDPSVVLAITVGILSGPMVKGKSGHKRTTNLLSGCLRCERLDLEALRPYTAKERRVGMRRVMRSEIGEALRADIIDYSRSGDRNDLARMCLRFLMLTDIPNPDSDTWFPQNLMDRMLKTLPAGQTVEALAGDDNPYVREFASRVVVHAAIS